MAIMIVFETYTIVFCIFHFYLIFLLDSYTLDLFGLMRHLNYFLKRLILNNQCKYKFLGKIIFRK